MFWEPIFMKLTTIKLFQKKMKLNHKDISKQILFRNPINHSSVFFKKINPKW